jgi:hypothetical protein
MEFIPPTLPLVERPECFGKQHTEFAFAELHSRPFVWPIDTFRRYIGHTRQ